MLASAAAAIAAISYDPIVNIDLGPLNISPHGIGIAVGFLLGARLMIPAAQAKGIDEEDVISCLMRAALGALIGARLAYVINHLGDYSDDPLSAFKVWEGGISLLGGIFGAILLAMPEMKKRGMDFWKTMDAAAPGLALGIIIGRVGDLVVGDHLGKPTDFFLGYRCPSPASVGRDVASPCVDAVVHQTALYDLLLTSVLLGVLLLLRRKVRWDGFLITFFAAWYGVGRIIEDFLREDLRRFGLTGSQWTALATLTISVGWLLFARRTPKWGRWERDEDVEPEAAGPAPGAEARSMAAPPEADRLDREE